MIITGCKGAAANDSLYHREPQSQVRTLLCQVLHKYKLMTCGNVYIHKNRDRGIKKNLIYLFKCSQKNMGMTSDLNHHCKKRKGRTG